MTHIKGLVNYLEMGSTHRMSAANIDIIYNIIILCYLGQDFTEARLA